MPEQQEEAKQTCLTWGLQLLHCRGCCFDIGGDNRQVLLAPTHTRATSTGEEAPPALPDAERPVVEVVKY